MGINRPCELHSRRPCEERAFLSRTAIVERTFFAPCVAIATQGASDCPILDGMSDQTAYDDPIPLETRTKLAALTTRA